MVCANSLLVKWTKDLLHLQSTPWSKKWSSFAEPNGQLHPIEHELLMFIFSQREQGININYSLVCLKASLMLLNTFGTKSYEACLKVVICFMRKHKYMYQQKTNKATCAPQEVFYEARELLEFTCLLLLGPHRNRRWIINMDQTPLHFSYHSSKTLEKCGAKMIQVCKTSNETKRATGALTITAAGDFLMPMIIFKGKPDGHITNGHFTKKELPKFDPSSIYACQEAACMDERCMLLWSNQILSLYLVVNLPPLGIQPVILLDTYGCLMMALVVTKIFKLGIKVIHIPGGCTTLCQLLSIGMNKPVKQHVCHLWEKWMMEMLDRDGEICEATCKEVAELTASVCWNMVDSKILKNAWQKRGYG